MSSQVHTPSRSSFPVVVAIIGMFLLFWFLTSKVYIDQAEESPSGMASRYTQVEKSLEEHRGAAASLLSNSQVTDAANGKVRLDIDRAKELVIAENTK